MNLITRLPFWVLIIGSLTLGLAPFAPPHLFEKTHMLFNGELTEIADIFDFLLHALFPILLILKIIFTFLLKDKSE